MMVSFDAAFILWYFLALHRVQQSQWVSPTLMMWLWPVRIPIKDFTANSDDHDGHAYHDNYNKVKLDQTFGNKLCWCLLLPGWLCLLFRARGGHERGSGWFCLLCRWPGWSLFWWKDATLLWPTAWGNLSPPPIPPILPQYQYQYQGTTNTNTYTTTAPPWPSGTADAKRGHWTFLYTMSPTLGLLLLSSHFHHASSECVIMMIDDHWPGAADAERVLLERGHWPSPHQALLRLTQVPANTWSHRYLVRQHFHHDTANHWKTSPNPNELKSFGPPKTFNIIRTNLTIISDQN